MSAVSSCLHVIGSPCKRCGGNLWHARRVSRCVQCARTADKKHKQKTRQLKKPATSVGILLYKPWGHKA